MTVTPIDLFASFSRLHQDGQAHAEQHVFVAPTRDGWQLKTFPEDPRRTAASLLAFSGTPRREGD